MHHSTSEALQSPQDDNPAIGHTETDANNDTAQPVEIAVLGQLEKLNISGEQLSNLSELLGGLKSLRQLDLHESSVQHLPTSLGDLTSLTKISLSGCHSLDLEQAFSVMSRLPNLRYLDLSYCSFTTLPAQLGDCRALEFLDVSGNLHLQDIEDGTKPLPNWHTIRLEKSGTAFKKALKKLLPDGRLINKWTYEGRSGTAYDFGGVQRYVRKGADLVWNGVRINPLP